MISRKDSNWLNNYEALEAYILERDIFRISTS